VREVAPRERQEGRGLPVVVEAAGELVGASGVEFTAGVLGPAIGYWWKDPRAPQPSQARAGPCTGADELGAPRVHLVADVRNERSLAVARRAGFAQGGVARSGLAYRDGSRGDAALFSQLPTD
jgi:RimJ/RimL family protein N-acetyltransferase